MLSLVRNNNIIEPPQDIPLQWIDTNKSYSGFNNLPLSYLYNLGWKEVIDNQPVIDPIFEELIIGDWYYDIDNDCVTRSYSIKNMSLEYIILNLSIVASNYRHNYEIGGFDYNYRGIDVIILTDRESSQSKLMASTIKAKEGTRSNNDTWTFIKKNDNSIILVELSNEELLEISDLVFNNITNSFNILREIYLNILSCSTIEELKLKIDSNIINLNPWGV